MEMMKIICTKKEQQNFIDMIADAIKDCTLCVLDDECDKYDGCSDCVYGEIEWNITDN